MGLKQLFFNRKNSPTTTLALDIGTEFVKALICQTSPTDRSVHILGSGRQRQSLGDTQSGTLLDIASVLHNCLLAIHSAEQQANLQATDLLMGIGGELIKGKSTTIKVKRENPTQPLEMGELKSIVHKVQWKAFNQIRNTLALETGHDEIEVKLVHAAITKVIIDGQVATNPLGFQGKNLTLHVFNAFAPLTHFGSLQTIADELQLNLLGILAQPYALSRALLEEDGTDLSAIIIDIGGGTTDIALVENGIILGLKMFGLGGRTFTKRISHNLNISFREAERIKLTYSEGNLEKESEKIIRTTLATDSEVWLAGVELALQEYSEITTLPSRILLCGGGSRLPEITTALSSKSWHQNLSFTKKPTITTLSPSEIPHIIDETTHLKNPSDITPLALASLTPELSGSLPLMQKILRNMTNFIQK